MFIFYVFGVKSLWGLIHNVLSNNGDRSQDRSLGGYVLRVPGAPRRQSKSLETVRFLDVGTKILRCNGVEDTIGL